MNLHHLPERAVVTFSALFVSLMSTFAEAEPTVSQAMNTAVNDAGAASSAGSLADQALADQLAVQIASDQTSIIAAINQIFVNAQAAQAQRLTLENQIIAFLTPYYTDPSAAMSVALYAMARQMDQTKWWDAATKYASATSSAQSVAETTARTPTGQGTPYSAYIRAIPCEPTGTDDDSCPGQIAQWISNFAALIAAWLDARKTDDYWQIFARQADSNYSFQGPPAPMPDLAASGQHVAISNQTMTQSSIALALPDPTSPAAGSAAAEAAVKATAAAAAVTDPMVAAAYINLIGFAKQIQAFIRQEQTPP